MKKLKIKSLPKKRWVDKDMLMLHCCFQILSDYVNKEDGLKHCDYETHKEEIETCRELFNWWEENKKTVSIDSLEADEMLLKLIKIRGFLWT